MPGCVDASHASRHDWCTQRVEPLHAHGATQSPSAARPSPRHIQHWRAVSDAVSVPVIASGGVGTLAHLSEGIRIGGADAVLAASIFHDGHFTIAQAKAQMALDGLTVRQ